MNKYKVIKEVSRSGYPIYKVNDYYLHSKYDPIKEAEKVADKYFNKNHVHIIFGHGAGYLTRAIQEKISENEFVVVIEPIEEIAKEVLLDSDKNHKRTLILVGDEISKFRILFSKIVNSYRNRVIICSASNYEKFLPEYYKDILKIVDEEVKINQVNVNTINRYASDWQKNYTLNLFYAFNDVSLKEFFNCINTPLVVAAGGPSLTKQLPLLKKIKDKIILVAAGSTVNTLLKNNIEPDLVITIDGGIANYDHFKSVFLNDSEIIYSLSHHHLILDHFNKRSISFLNEVDFEIQPYAEYMLDRKMTVLPPRPSVANSALDISYKLTTGPIVLIGQDLAYTNDQTHAEANKNFKKIDDDYKKQRNMVRAEGYNGEIVWTDYGFLSMKKNFEEYIEKLDDKERVFNATEGGIKLRGYQQITFDDFVGRFVSDRKKERLSNLSSFTNRSLEDWNGFLERVNQEIKTHNRVKQLLQKGQKALKRNSLKTAFEPRVIKQLDLVDRELKPLYGKGMVSFITKPILLDIFNDYLPKENETSEETYNRVYSRSFDLYSRLEKSAEESKAYFIELKEKIETKIKMMEREIV
ncbi:motility associated factor glycosyltransferase family protein [Robertmurraya massiliosenegalensis]|uniref:motility associated factor glycosyltransferase family protein n=1 Tax=Robertmurraya massiliosenegalensis TaxID=1287657 RepID=UPI0002EEA98D|nr:6-hydroxymethylpterin diphosphokinase MptE-like protein [Robertmurraya massiliosenegalensis]